MSVDELRNVILSGSETALVQLTLTDASLPFVFADKTSAWEKFRNELVAGLKIDEGDVRVVGSGRLGFSLAPGRNLQAFRDESDIDVVVVNARLFDDLWIGLLRAGYPRPPVDMSPSGWRGKTQRSVFTGWMEPQILQIDRRIAGSVIDQVLSVRTSWFSSLKKAARHVVRRHEDVSGRLYRTWSHAELYHSHSVAALRASLENAP